MAETFGGIAQTAHLITQFSGDVADMFDSWGRIMAQGAVVAYGIGKVFRVVIDWRHRWQDRGRRGVGNGGV